MPGDYFDRIHLFDGLSQAELAPVKLLFTPCDYDPEAQLFTQGDPAEFLFVVVHGEVVVNFKPDDAPPLTVARIKPPGVVGWSAALGSKRYTSSAFCTAYTQLLRIRSHDLRWLCEQHPTTGALILERLAALIAERLKNTHPQVKSLLQAALFSGVSPERG